MNSCCDVYCEREQYANMIISKADDYIKINGEIPKDIDELGLEEKENSLAYFLKVSEDKYVVWYGTNLGDSNVYNSKTKTWYFD